MSDAQSNTNLANFIESVSKGDVFFFAGSGISIDSTLPSAPDILRKTVQAVLPPLATHDIDKLCKIQPEILYEVLINITGTLDSLHLWSSLNEKTQERFGIACEPNLAHYFIVEQAARNRFPIFTTNFDMMFETAAKSIGLEAIVYEPSMSPPLNSIPSSNSIAICKLHGTIEDATGKYTPESLWTTMTQISKVNAPWLNYIFHCMNQAHLCFVGYSARDIDLFPHIEDFANQPNSKPIFWINRFERCNSDRASKRCNAVRIENMWAAQAFEHAMAQLNISGGWAGLVTAPHSREVQKPMLTKMLESLAGELSETLKLSTELQQLILGLLLARLGEFADGSERLRQLEAGPSNGLNAWQRGELILACARLSHEISQYETCRYYAKQALTQARSVADLRLDIQIQARCLISESLRMSIPHETYFPDRRTIDHYLLIGFALFHFVFTAGLNGCGRFFAGKKLKDLNIAPQHEILEHLVRLGAFIQRLRMLPGQRWGPVSRKVLQVGWKRLRKKSYELGYAAGIANCGRFLFRLNPTTKTMTESDNIYELMTYSTGKELSERNLADMAMNGGNFVEARQRYTEFVERALRSGNKLNAIKGLSGIMFTNNMSRVKPLLDEKNAELFKALIADFEGRLWRKHFRYLEDILNENLSGNDEGAVAANRPPA